MVRDKILQKLNSHEDHLLRHDQNFLQIDKRFDVIESRLDRHDLQLEAVIGKLGEHDQRFDVLEFKVDSVMSELLQGQDEIMKILKHLDQERIFTAEWIKRLDGKVETHETKIAEHDELLKNINPIVKPV